MNSVKKIAKGAAKIPTKTPREAGVDAPCQPRVGQTTTQAPTASHETSAFCPKKPQRPNGKREYVFDRIMQDKRQTLPKPPSLQQAPPKQAPQKAKPARRGPADAGRWRVCPCPAENGSCIPGCKGRTRKPRKRLRKRKDKLAHVARTRPAKEGTGDTRPLESQNGSSPIYTAKGGFPPKKKGMARSGGLAVETEKKRPNGPDDPGQPPSEKTFTPEFGQWFFRLMSRVRGSDPAPAKPSPSKEAHLNWKSSSASTERLPPREGADFERGSPFGPGCGSSPWHSKRTGAELNRSSLSNQLKLRVISQLQSISEEVSRFEPECAPPGTGDSSLGAIFRLDALSQSMRVISMDSLRSRDTKRQKSAHAQSLIMERLHSIDLDTERGSFLDAQSLSGRANHSSPNFHSQIDNQSSARRRIKTKKNLSHQLDPPRRPGFDWFHDTPRFTPRLSSPVDGSRPLLWAPPGSALDPHDRVDRPSPERDLPKGFGALVVRKTRARMQVALNRVLRAAREESHAFVPGDKGDRRTRLMVQNLPNKYMLLQLVDLFGEDFDGRFNSVYLHVDDRTECNRGYCFVNLQLRAKDAFFDRFNGRGWPRSRSAKRCKITYAHVQTIDRIDRDFIEKYRERFKRVWVPPPLILARYPQLESQLFYFELERRRWTNHILRRWK